MTEIKWLICKNGVWKVISTCELKDEIHDGFANCQIWRLIYGKQPESRYVDGWGMVRDIFGNAEVL